MSRSQIIKAFWVVSIILMIFFSLRMTSNTTIQMPNGTWLEIELANNDLLRQQGLSGRVELATDTGMLFVFNEVGFPAFWMKDMQFDLDIIWISPEGKVVGVVERLQPESFPETVSPEEPTLFVLEVNGGQAARLGLELGAQLDLDRYLLP